MACGSTEVQGCSPKFLHDYHIPSTSTTEQLENTRERIQELETLVEKMDI